MAKLASDEQLKTLGSRDGAKPRVYYKNSHLFDAAFIGGTIITERDGKEDCVEGAIVRATSDGQEIGRTISDAFGDFRIEKLTPGSGEVLLHIESNGKAVEHRLDLGESTYVGCITV